MPDRRTFMVAAAMLLGMPPGSVAQRAGASPRIGVLVSATDARESAFWRAMHELGYVEGRNIAVDWRSAEGDFARLPALAAELVRLRPDAVMVLSDTAFVANAARIADLCRTHRLAAVSGSRPLVDAGILATYGPNQAAIAARAANHVDRILKGAKPGDLPIEQPTSFELVINLKTARELGLVIPPSLLARADAVIR